MVHIIIYSAWHQRLHKISNKHILYLWKEWCVLLFSTSCIDTVSILYYLYQLFCCYYVCIVYLDTIFVPFDMTVSLYCLFACLICMLLYCICVLLFWHCVLFLLFCWYCLYVFSFDTMFVFFSSILTEYPLFVSFRVLYPLFWYCIWMLTLYPLLRYYFWIDHLNTLFVSINVSKHSTLKVYIGQRCTKTEWLKLIELLKVWRRHSIDNDVKRKYIEIERCDIEWNRAKLHKWKRWWSW